MPPAQNSNTTHGVLVISPQSRVSKETGANCYQGLLTLLLVTVVVGQHFKLQTEYILLASLHSKLSDPAHDIEIWQVSGNWFSPSEQQLLRCFRNISKEIKVKKIYSHRLIEVR